LGHIYGWVVVLVVVEVVVVVGIKVVERVFVIFL